MPVRTAQIGSRRSGTPATLRILATSLLSALFLAALAYLASGLLEPRYKARAHLMTDGHLPVASGEEVRNPGNIAAATALGGLITPEVLAGVVEQLGLARSPGFLSPSGIHDLTNLIGGSQITEPAEAVALRRLWEGLTIRQPLGSPLIAVEFASTDPQLARDVPNAVVQAVLRVAAGAAADAGAEQERAAEIARLRAAVEAADEQLRVARSAAEAAAEPPVPPVSVRVLAEIAADLSSAREARIEAEMALRRLRSAVEDGDASQSAGAGSEELTALLEQRRRWRATVAELSATLLDQHPRMRDANARLREVEEAVRSAGERDQQQLQSRVAELRQREAELNAELDAAEAAEASANEAQSGEEVIQSLEREAAEAARLFQLALLRQRESATPADAGIHPQSLRVLSEAQLPKEPYFPDRRAISGAAGVLGFLLSGTIGLIRRRRGDHEADPLALDDADSAQGSAVALPDTLVHPTGTGDSNPRSTLPRADWPAATVLPFPAEAAGVGEIAEAIETSGINRVLVISARSNEVVPGASALARRLAVYGKSVAVVDLSRDGLLTQGMELPAGAKGLSDVLEGKTAIGDIIVRDRFTGSDFLPRGRAEPASPRFATALRLVLEALEQTYDCSLFECDAADVKHLKSLAGEDAALLVATPDVRSASVAEILSGLAEAGSSEVMVMQVPGTRPAGSSSTA